MRTELFLIIIGVVARSAATVHAQAHATPLLARIAYGPVAAHASGARALSPTPSAAAERNHPSVRRNLGNRDLGGRSLSDRSFVSGGVGL